MKSFNEFILEKHSLKYYSPLARYDSKFKKAGFKFIRVDTHEFKYVANEKSEHTLSFAEAKRIIQDDFKFVKRWRDSKGEYHQFEAKNQPDHQHETITLIADNSVSDNVTTIAFEVKEFA